MDLLFVSANSRKEYIDVEREHRTLQTLLEQDTHSLQVLPAAEVNDLREALRMNKTRQSFDALHFCGHASAEHGLHLRGHGHRTEYLTSRTLRGWLKNAGLDLVVLNACNSASVAKSISKVVPMVIGTTREVRDIAARQFTRDFYTGLTSGLTVTSAFSRALDKQRPSSTPAYVLLTDRSKT